jgi:DNA-binding response OmpR family regulator
VARRRGRREDGVDDAGSPNVLVVGDDPDAAELLVRLLTRAGNEVDRARDLLELSDRLLVGRPVDCIVLDVVSGGLGGNLKLLDAVRNHREPAVATTPVVIIAPHATSAVFSWQAGVDELLVRPFEAAALCDAVTSAIARPLEARVRHRNEQAELAKTASRRSF